HERNARYQRLHTLTDFAEKKKEEPKQALTSPQNLINYEHRRRYTGFTQNCRFHLAIEHSHTCHTFLHCLLPCVSSMGMDSEHYRPYCREYFQDGAFQQLPQTQNWHVDFIGGLPVEHRGQKGR